MRSCDLPFGVDKVVPMDDSILLLLLVVVMVVDVEVAGLKCIVQ